MNGRELALTALSGKCTEKVPVGIFTWCYNYLWKTAGLTPWQLALGSNEMWHHAHLSLFNRHKPDIFLYSGPGSGPNEPRLDFEDDENWYVTDMNTGVEYIMIKSSSTLIERNNWKKPCAPHGIINSKEDADRLLQRPDGRTVDYLNGLTRLINEVGDKALILTIDITSYIAACYAFGFESAMITIMENPELFRYVMDIYATSRELSMKQLKSAGAEAVFVADAWSSADIISPAIFEQFCYPSQCEVLGHVQKAGLKAIFWDEGDVAPQLHRLATLPLDSFAVEQERKGAYVSVSELCETFKGKCVFGNLDSEIMLLTASDDEIAAQTVKQIDESNGAPFIVFTGSPLPDETDPDKVDVITNAARSYKR